MQEDAWLRLWSWSWFEEVKKVDLEPDPNKFIFQPIGSDNVLENEQDILRIPDSKRRPEF